jgi:hypothetical protein
MTTVQGRAAVAWDCPACLTRQFAEMVPVEVTDEDLRQQPELGVTDWVAKPATVKCVLCRERFGLVYGEE